MTKHIDLTNINELKERLGKWSKVAKYYGISERTLFNYRKNKSFIKENLDTRNYNQFGKNKKRMNRELREKVRYERSYTEPTKAETQAQQLEEVVKKPLSKKEAEELRKADIRANNPSYLKMKEEEGEAFADAVFFGVNK